MLENNMHISDWDQLPEDMTYQLDQQELAEVWDKLHQGDQYPYPLDRDDYEQEALDAQAQAWLYYHNGDFENAAKLAYELGDFGAVILARSVTAYCDFICEDEEQIAELLSSAIEICEASTELLPECANTQFVTALLMGRYAQAISITKALSQGLAGKVKKHLTATLELEPNHSEAHTALGVYHAEIIDSIGSMLGGLTYGAKKSSSIEHFEKSLELTPDSPVAAREFANGLVMLGKDEERAAELYQHAIECTPHDAVQCCDIAVADDLFNSQFED